MRINHRTMQRATGSISGEYLSSYERKRIANKHRAAVKREYRERIYSIVRQHNAAVYALADQAFDAIYYSNGYPNNYAAAKAARDAVYAAHHFFDCTYL